MRSTLRFLPARDGKVEEVRTMTGNRLTGARIGLVNASVQRRYQMQPVMGCHNTFSTRSMRYLYTTQINFYHKQHQQYWDRK